MGKGMNTGLFWACGDSAHAQAFFLVIVVITKT
jgi:hypothetical protein